ncbi:MAG: fatty acid desaturase [Bacteroidia bacterium]|nr:fatty acid desaturase [Bacteroidia bacterium]
MQQVSSSRTASSSLTGVWIGLAVMLVWSLVLALNLTRPVDWVSPLTWIMVLVQTHLFTGLFITAHDAMHGTVAPGYPRLNHMIGRACTFLFIFNRYQTLLPKHHLHHRHAGTADDPDFHNGNPRFWAWYWDFLREYISWQQILLAAVTFNIAAIWIPQPNLILYWVVPSLLSTLQLFYFGTFLPHMGEHDNVHNARSQPVNHVWAFLTCYFFGYHYEHHDKPGTPWWRLWRTRSASV